MVERNIKLGLTVLLFCYCMHDRTVFRVVKKKKG